MKFPSLENSEFHHFGNYRPTERRSVSGLTAEAAAVVVVVMANNFVCQK
jgi:hypothetical protein